VRQRVAHGQVLGAPAAGHVVRREADGVGGARRVRARVHAVLADASLVVRAVRIDLVNPQFHYAAERFSHG